MLCGTGGLERTQSIVQTPLVDDSWPHQVCEGLYVGSAQASTNLQRLQQYDIGHIVNAATATEGCHFRQDGIIYHGVDVLDGVNESISHVFALTNAFIDNVISHGGCVLVHCHSGVSRAATICMAYLIYKRNCSVSDALSTVRLARPTAQPNEGFMRQLEKYFAERN